MIISGLVTIIGALVWWLGTGKIESAGYIIFAVGVFYFVGAIHGGKLSNPFTTKSGG